MNNKIIDILERKIKIKKEFDFETTFPPLGHPEHHFNKYQDHPWLKSAEEVKDWIRDNTISSYHNIYIHDDLTVTVKPKSSLNQNRFVLGHSEATCKKVEISHIPVQFRSAINFSLTENILSTAIGTPYVCQQLLLEDNKINSFIGISDKVEEYVKIENNNIDNFQHMPAFKSGLTLCLYNNPFKNWENFNTNAEKINIQFGNYSFSNSIHDLLILNLPNNVNSAYMISTSNFSHNLKNKVSNFINMEDLEDYRSSKEFFKSKSKIRKL